MAQPDVCKLCLDYALGETRDELTKRRFERHLRTCAVCEAELKEYREMIWAITQPDEATPNTSADHLHLVGNSGSRHPYKTRRIPTFFASRLGRVSVSATALLTMLVTLLHGGHFHHVRAFSAHTLHRVSQAVTYDGAHLRNDFRHL